MIGFRPKYITFDCYGTLIRFRMSDMTRVAFASRVPAERMDDFIRDFAAYRFDEVLGAWKPYRDVIVNALARTCKLWGLAFDEAEGETLYRAIPEWDSYPDVPAPLTRIAKSIPLVGLSNAANDQIPSNIAKMGAPFHAVFTAESARAYKPRLQAFEYMFDQLGCSPSDVLHVSSSLRYDLIPAWMLRIRARVWVARGHDYPNPHFGYTEIKDIGGLPALLGL